MKKWFLFFMLAYSQSFSIGQILYGLNRGIELTVRGGGAVAGLTGQNNFRRRVKEGKEEAIENKRALHQAGEIINRLVNTGRRAHNTLFNIYDYDNYEELNIKARANRAYEQLQKYEKLSRTISGRRKLGDRMFDHFDYINNELSYFERELIRRREYVTGARNTLEKIDAQQRLHRYIEFRKAKKYFNNR